MLVGHYDFSFQNIVFASYTKSNTKKMGNRLELFGTGDNFLNREPKARALMSKVHKCDFIKLKTFYKSKDPIIRTKQEPTDWEGSSLTLHPAEG